MTPHATCSFLYCESKKREPVTSLPLVLSAIGPTTYDDDCALACGTYASAVHALSWRPVENCQPFVVQPAVELTVSTLAPTCTSSTYQPWPLTASSVA